jgi:eukaryotic-like serine/threonine-protein kinase
MTEHEIFAAAIKLNGDGRTAFLDVACGNNLQLRQQVDALLRAHEDSGGILPNKADFELQSTKRYAIHAEPGMLVGGRYKLLEAVGEGGMGTVWIAEQREPVKRKVAIKLVKAGMDSRQVLARFDAERQALALMDHPNIAKVFDGGMTEQGRPFFVMEFVKGVPLTDYCDQARLSLKERLNLFVPVCQAVQHAHQKGIIHRDLKPSNILVCLYDGQPVPKVIDFGLAKALHQSLTEDTLHTALGTMVGTPLYMSPEQAEHNNLDVDTRTDIYSLGVILYELLTGTTPLEKQQLKLAAYNEILRLIKEVEPPKPSLRLSGSASLPSVAAQRSIEPKQLSRSLTGDLDWIVMKSLEKERSRRYATASSFAEDVQHYLALEPVSAGPPSKAYYLRKWIHRHRRPVIAVSFVILSLIAGVIGTGVGLSRAITAEKDAIESADLARESEKKAIESEAQMLENFRESTDDTIRLLIGEKQEIGPREREYLERTLQRWQSFADKQADDERGRVYRAEGHARIGAVWEALGRKEDAVSAYARARDIRRELVAQHPSVVEYQTDLAATHSAIGNVYLFDRNNSALALEEYNEARALYRELTKQYPAVAKYQQLLAKNYSEVGTVHKGQKDGARARIEMEFARDVQKKLVRQFPDVLEHKQELADYHLYLGIVLDQRLKDPAAARIEFEAAQAILRDMDAKFPVDVQSSNSKYLQSLVKTHSSLSDVAYFRGQFAEAVAEMQAAADLRSRLLVLSPSDPENRFELGLLYLRIASVYDEMGESLQALAMYDSSRQVIQNLFYEFPSDSKYRMWLVASHIAAAELGLRIGDAAKSLEMFLQSLALVEPASKRSENDDWVHQIMQRGLSGQASALIQLGRDDEAEQAWNQAMSYYSEGELSKMKLARIEAYLRSEKFLEGVSELDAFVIELVDSQQPKTAKERVDEFYQIGYLYSLVSPKMGEKQKQYADLAMKWLQESVVERDGSPYFIAHLVGDLDLIPLREREDFKALLRTMEASQSK